VTITYERPFSLSFPVLGRRISGRCVEKRHVAFLKVHKTGSTTVMNMMLRFATSRNLSIALPKHFNQLAKEHNVIDRQKLLPAFNGSSRYEILCNHVVYSRETFRDAMAVDSEFVAIVRHPWEEFVSAFLYFKHTFNVPYLSTLNGRSMISDYLKNFDVYEAKAQKQSFTNNRMSFDFGIPRDKFSNTTYVRNYIKQLDSDFKLVMITEYFDESVVLLMRFLCWTFKDILYISQNSFKSQIDVALDIDTFRRHRHVTPADYMLYDHFHFRFWQMVEGEGPDFFLEVQYFKRVRREVCMVCLQQDAVFTDEVVYTEPASEWGDGFQVTVADCTFMRTPELKLLDRVRQWYTDYTTHNKPT
jgi:hypothetical protein